MPSRLPKSEIQTILDSAYRNFHTQFHREKDPVHWPHQFSVTADKEVAAFLSAILAYGNVTSILGSLQKVFAALGPYPSQGLCRNDLSERLHGFYHRFNKAEDIEIVCGWLREVLERSGSLEAFFSSGTRSSHQDSLSSFVERLTALPLPDRLNKQLPARQRNVDYLISNPARGSSCKRLNLFLRWVVRPSDGIDLGIWQSVRPADLLVPVDTHVLKVIRELGWTQSKSARWVTAEEATSQLRKFCPDDPVRYDFSLCHLSMSGLSVKKYHAQMER